MESDLNQKQNGEGMNNEDFEPMRLLSDEIQKDIIYKDTNGCYNFEMLEGFLRKHKLMTQNALQRFDELRERVGIPRQYGGEELTKTVWELFELDPKNDRTGWSSLIQSWFARPEYEYIAHWYQWTRLLKNCQQSTPPPLTDNWIIEYVNLFYAIQVCRDLHEDYFVSILGPKLDYYKGSSDPTDPFFEIYGRKENERSLCIRGIASYTEVMRTARKNFGIEIPTESEIERVIASVNTSTKNFKSGNS